MPLRVELLVNAGREACACICPTLALMGSLQFCSFAIDGPIIHQPGLPPHLWRGKLRTGVPGFAHSLLCGGFRGPPELNCHGSWADNRQRVIGRVDVFVQPQHHFHRCDQERHQALRPFRRDRRLRVRDHEENEELIHRPGDRRGFGQEPVAGDQASQRRENKKGNHVGCRDVETLHAPGNDRPQRPHNQQRQDIIAPLNAQCRHRFRRKQQQDADARSSRGSTGGGLSSG